MKNNIKIIYFLIFVISLLTVSSFYTLSIYTKKITISDTIKTKELKITFETNGDDTLSKINGSIVNISDTHSDYLVSLKYVWSTTDNTIASEGTDFISGDNIISSTLNGTYYLCIYALDDKGFYNNKCSNAFYFDNTAPEVEITYDGNDTYKHSQSSTVTVTNDEYGAELDLDSIKYVWTKNIYVEPNDSFTSGDTLTKDTGHGEYYLKITACDTLGNCNNFQSDSFKVDNDGPEVTLTPSTGADVRTYINFDAIDDETGIVGYSITTTNTEPTSWIPVLNEVESTTEVKQEYGATWARVFHHNNRWGETYFANANEVLSINTLDKYSVLNDLNKYKGSDGKFEFLLQYPDADGTKYNRWKQTDNPATLTVANGDGSEFAPGYEAIHIDWAGSYWGGLALSTTTATYINGSVGHGNWWYALGTYSAYNSAMPGPSLVIDSGVNAKHVATANLWVRIDGLTPVNKNTLSGRLGDLKDGTYYIWFKDGLGNVSKYEQNIERKYILKINPNGGSWNGSTSTSTGTYNFTDALNIPNPTRTGYSFAGWNELSGAAYATGLTSISVYNNAGNGVVTHTSQTRSSDNPVSILSNEIKIVNSGTAATSPGLGGFYQGKTAEANHSYVHLFIAKLPVGYYFHEAHNALGNGYTKEWLTTNKGTGKFQLYAYKINAGSSGTFSTFSHVYVSKSDSNVWGSAQPETGAITWYLAYSNIYDITNGSTGTTYSPAGIAQLIGTGKLTAKWTANNYTVTCEDWFVDASNNRKVKIGSSTKSYAYGTTASGADWGSDGTTSKYYSGYAYKSATSGTVPANNNLVVYRYFHAWTDLNIYYAGGSTQNGATVGLKVGNGSWTDVTNESNTVQPYGTTYYINNIRPKNSYEELSSVSNLTWNASGSYYYYTPTAGGTSMNIYMKYKTYTISYNLNGGSVSGNPTSYNYSTAAFTLKNPTRSGYTFTGWTGTGLSSASTSVTVPTHSTGNRSYTANWKQNCTFTSKDFSYTGGVQSWTVPSGCAGKYRLEVWGARGSDEVYDRHGVGGKGGYSKGEVNLSNNQTIYVVVGGYTGTAAGGYNGGGESAHSGYCNGGGGGGATHIGTFNSTLAAHGNTSGLYIVAGGGGGGSEYGSEANSGGVGGGSSGGNGGGNGSAGGGGYGGTQSSGNAFGQGGRSCGGGLYGGRANGNGGGGGGSGYIGGVSNGQTIAGNASMPKYSGSGNMTGNDGNGYARITKIG